MKSKTEKEWEENVLMELIELGKEYEPSFFASMLIKFLWAVQDE